MTLLSGTADHDLLNGTSGADSGTGLSGRDTMHGKGGADTLSGGEGRDILLGGAGNDVLFGFGASDADAATGRISAKRIASGFDAPVFATSAPGDAGRLFVVEKSGHIRILDLGTGDVNGGAFLNIPANQLTDNDEQGLLGLAFHPDYATNGKFYIYLVNEDGDLEVRQGQRSVGDPDIANATTDLILKIPHPTNENHNGGWMAFGPDGMLYIAVGDGGSGGDPAGNAQNKNVLLGKMLRIDVNSDDFAGNPDKDYAIPDDNPFANSAGADEIWATGLRNPWRNAFDRVTGDLYIADVGQDAHEEVNFQAFGSAGGLNFGWNIREGFSPYGDGGNPPGLTNPLIDYDHGVPNGGSSITGGYVYRGMTGGMKGTYFYADFISNQIWSFRVVDGKAVDAINRTAQLTAKGGTVDGISSFAEDGNGNLYIIGFDGEIYRMTPGIGAGDGADSINGGAGNDSILGGAGNDTLRGGADNDTIRGNDQNDLISGGAGRDLMSGGLGADIFDFNAATDSAPGTRDRILDFGVRDKIDLATLDASTGTVGNQAFTFIGKLNFSAEGQIRAVQAGDDVILQLNMTGKSQAEMQIILEGTDLSEISASDFIL